MFPQPFRHLQKVLSEEGSVPAAFIAARLILVAAFLATLPVIVDYRDGRLIFWAALIPILPMLWVLGGFHLWRRICPLAFVSQLPRMLGIRPERRVGGWLAKHYMLLQLGLMVLALSLRLLATNGSPLALVGFLLAVLFVAVSVGLFLSGKSFCNFVCPVGLVEKIYTEPARSLGEYSSQCHPCTACKKNCPDIDYPRSYWRERMWPSRRLAYFAWPGVVFAFYFYFYLVSGSWDYFFSGDWTRESDQARTWLEAGFYFGGALPRAIAAPLTLVLGGVVSFLLLALVEAQILRVLLRKADGNPELMRRRVRHRMLAGAGFIAFLLFYFWGGQPVLRMAPGWARQLFSTAVVIAATTVFWNRANANQTERAFFLERLNKKLQSRRKSRSTGARVLPPDLYQLRRVEKRESLR